MQKRRFRDHWRRKSESRPGRPGIDPENGALIRQISQADPGWGSPRIVGALAKLGIVLAKSTVERYRVRAPGPPSPTWRAFLETHVKDLVSIDFFVVPTVRFEILYVLVVLAHARRRVVHFNVTPHPRAQWTAQQMVEAFRSDTAPRYLIRARDGIDGAAFRRRVRSVDIEEELTAPRSPWQTPYAERLLGTVRRECLDNVVVLRERRLRAIVRSDFSVRSVPHHLCVTTHVPVSRMFAQLELLSTSRPSCVCFRDPQVRLTARQDAR